MTTEPEWCSRCEQHRVAAKDRLCPVCTDDDRIAKLEQKRAGGWI